MGYHSGRHLARTQGQEQAEGTDQRLDQHTFSPALLDGSKVKVHARSCELTTWGVKARRLPDATSDLVPETSHPLRLQGENLAPRELRAPGYKRHFTSLLVPQTVKNLLVVQEIPVQSLGREDPLEKEMATHSSIFGWRIPRTEEPCGATFHGIMKC